MVLRTRFYNVIGHELAIVVIVLFSTLMFSFPFTVSIYFGLGCWCICVCMSPSVLCENDAKMKRYANIVHFDVRPISKWNRWLNSTEATVKQWHKSKWMSRVEGKIHTRQQKRCEQTNDLYINHRHFSFNRFSVSPFVKWTRYAYSKTQHTLLSL